MFVLQEAQGLALSLHLPEDGFYQGTRFDRSGVFEGIRWRGTELCGQWFERYDPFAHDAVQGPAEEFSAIGYEQAPVGGRFLKIGVGWLQRPDDAPYDRFRLYPVLEGGQWTVETSSTSVRFCQELDGAYTYVKEVVLTGPSGFEIRHSLTASRLLEGSVYNHHFFTLGRLAVGPSRALAFPFVPEGTWRAAYDSVAFVENGIRFSRALQPGESVFSGDVHQRGAEGMPYALTLSEGTLAVAIRGDHPVTHMVFWANHRVACPEPYQAFSIAPGNCFRWIIQYQLYEL